MNPPLPSVWHPPMARSDSPPALPSPALGSLAHLMCDDRDYGDGEFIPALMRTCLARRARPFYLLFPRTEFFAADRELIGAMAHARTMADVEDAIDDYWVHPANRTWLRRTAGLRVSTLRLRQIAGDYLPPGKPQHPRRGPHSVS